ncbi:hypothetical protein Tdes44962_MAKER01641 [Teratosphaeria destructans]|uniref:Uncharacterized protein n=1 Tax=Teratosphaeria destructans TaxID=418781 RepID=A0A9W7W5M2_9PEZI|nr:hypothetical protein Tdes44962_MAKER01641 [Teratosphaeria destructans]
MSSVVEAPVTEEDASFDSGVKLETAESDEATAIGSGASGQDEEVTVDQYSNEARVYHSKYAELSQAYNDKRYAYCREGCLDLLTEPNLPQYTRIQTLQMISTIVFPEHAEELLREADDLLSEMDAAKFQVQLLKEDNEKMKRDLAVWRGDGTLDPYTPTQEWEELHEMIVQEREGADYKPAADREN